MKKLFYLSIALTIVAITSCTKEEDDDITKPASELIVGTWKLSSSTINPAYDWNGDGNLITNIFSTLMPCATDDEIRFNANGTFDYVENTPCKTQEEVTYSFLNDNQLLLTYTDSTGSDTDTLDIEVTESSFKITQMFNEGGTTYTIKDGYTKQ